MLPSSIADLLLDGNAPSMNLPLPTFPTMSYWRRFSSVFQYVISGIGIVCLINFSMPFSFANIAALKNSSRPFTVISILGSNSWNELTEVSELALLELQIVLLLVLIRLTL